MARSAPEIRIGIRIRLTAKNPTNFRPVSISKKIRQMADCRRLTPLLFALFFLLFLHQGEVSLSTLRFSTLLHNDPAAHQDHCTMYICRIRNRDLSEALVVWCATLGVLVPSAFLICWENLSFLMPSFTTSMPFGWSTSVQPRN